MLLVCTAAELLRIGLTLVGHKAQRIDRATALTNRYRFRVHYGSEAKVVAKIFTDLQTTTIQEAYVPPGSSRNINHFLMAMHCLKACPTEMQREAQFNILPMWGGEWCWCHMKKTRALKAKKIKWQTTMVAMTHGF